MSNQFKNPIFWSVISFVLGLGIGAWGLIKEDADNYEGSGFLKALGIVLIIMGVVGMFTNGNRK